MPVKKQLKKVVKRFFDFSTLINHLNAEDPLALVIRGHLYVEAALIKQIESALVNKNAFDTAALRFPTKVKLAVALRKVDSADVGGFTALNDLRNKFAHNVEMTLTKRHPAFLILHTKRSATNSPAPLQFLKLLLEDLF